MDAFYERLAVRAATLDEVLSDDFAPLPGQKGDADLAARRLAAWCRASASGDWSLFGRRLDRDGLAFAPVLARLAAVRRTSDALPSWLEDAIWVEAALQDTSGNAAPVSDKTDPCAFEELFTSLVEQADTRLWSGLDARVGDNLNEAARASLRLALLRELSNLGMAALYERFAKARNASSPQHDAAGPAQPNGTSRYDRFVADMKAGGWRRLFEDKPVLLRLLATVTRQWIDTSREMVLRLDADLAAIRSDILRSGNAGRVAGFEGNLSDPHNHGRSVRIVSFEDGARVVYKPKDLRLDAAWHALVERLNGAQAPFELKAVRAIALHGYGWTEFIDHAACADAEGFARFFRRAGGWLALFHCFAATDMHQENMIACGDHPVPIDLEMILQAGAEERSAEAPEDFAFAAAAEIVSNSVTAVGLLPAYGRSPDNIVFAVGGMTADWTAKTEVTWDKINSDAMRPAKSNQAAKTSPNLPHVDGRNARFGDHVDDFVEGFEQYANFLLRRGRAAGRSELFDGFAGVPVRNVVRATRFYYMLLQRLRNHKTMDDGVIWSAQADFIARRPIGKASIIRFGRCSGPSARRWLRSMCRISSRPATATTSAMRTAIPFISRCPRASIVPGFALRISTSGRSTGRSRSSARIQTRSRALPSPRRRSYKRCRAEILLSRRPKRLSAPKPIGSRRNCRITPYAAARASPGSVSIGWAIPSFLSSSASVQTSTTAFAASGSFSRPMRR